MHYHDVNMLKISAAMFKDSRKDKNAKKNKMKMYVRVSYPLVCRQTWTIVFVYPHGDRRNLNSQDSWEYLRLNMLVSG